MFNIALCDNNQDEMKTILSLLARFKAAHPESSLSVQKYDSAEALLESINAGKMYDLFLLDVIMPGVSGIELARIIRERDADVPVVFLTGTADYALSAYKVSAMQYILKPVEEGEFFSVLKKILSLAKPKGADFFMLPIPEGTRKIPVADIVYMEITDHVMHVRLANGDMLSSKTIKVPFKTAAAPLFMDSRFLHPHKSYLINMEHVQELRGRYFIMTGNYMLPVPKSKIVEVKEQYYNFLSRFGYLRL